MDQGKIKKIREFWDEQARKYGEDYLATVPDKIIRELEIENISKYLDSEKFILDIGCGNGFSTIIFAENFNSLFYGVDYSKEMIKWANKSLKKKNEDIKKRVSFTLGDVLELPFPQGKFDIVISERCLINLVSIESQLKAIENIWKVLKKNGKYIMCEDTQEGLKKINELRKKVDLYEITMRWHNLYLSEENIFNNITDKFSIEIVDNFGSLYYIASRIFNAKLAELENKEPDYLHPINIIAGKLPSTGDYSPVKIFVLKKI